MDVESISPHLGAMPRRFSMPHEMFERSRPHGDGYRGRPQPQDASVPQTTMDVAERAAVSPGRFSTQWQAAGHQFPGPFADLAAAPHQIFERSSRAHHRGDRRPRRRDASAPEPAIAWYRNGGFGARPASGKAIARLPRAAAGEANEKENGCCSVCLEGFAESDELRTMPCSHAFHETCIFKWLGVSRLCPLCCFPLPAEEDAERV